MYKKLSVGGAGNGKETGVEGGMRRRECHCFEGNGFIGLGERRMETDGWIFMDHSKKRLGLRENVILLRRRRDLINVPFLLILIVVFVIPTFIPISFSGGLTFLFWFIICPLFLVYDNGMTRDIHIHEKGIIFPKPDPGPFILWGRTILEFSTVRACVINRGRITLKAEDGTHEFYRDQMEFEEYKKLRRAIRKGVSSYCEVTKE